MKQIKAWELLHLNQRLLERYGGLSVAPSKERLARIEALCERVRQICQYEEAKTLPQVGAVYCEVIARGHAFADANKRTAVNALYLFLHRNGVQTKVPSDLADFVVSVSTGSINRQEAAKYVEESISGRFQ
ncbi:MAG TPA: type II toxin-antitoxin system death-on-curing family toxin [Candidatus Aphodousia faecigallinarum]|uniref:Type II toxin-antitoxin system death-on-curing family toxin n=1 Tax=Candidatus Aphodousia faecigallinarum TaxID=2840677 RepID=A0A9D1LFL7_9BURK|nr:type II toxin-antitoxin system death-on-curing family toxin [Candidatus Aphodousia faecigallinarum]